MNEGLYAIAGYNGPLMRDRLGGGHGHDPRRTELFAFFLISGPGVARGSTRPIMRQTEVAEIVARALSVRMLR
jgi:hypothetical protein